MNSERVAGKISMTEIRFYPGTVRTRPQKTNWKIRITPKQDPGPLLGS
jgi:hypothetical protein